MAELKNFDPHQYEHPAKDTADEEMKPKTEPIKIASSPAKRLKKISKLEKFFVAMLGLMMIATALFTIQVRNTISKTENEISALQADIVKKEEEANRLEQEKSELSRSDRIKKVADDEGLTVNDENLRKVK